MLEDGSVDYDLLKRLIDWHIPEGTTVSVRGWHHRRIATVDGKSTARSSKRLWNMLPAVPIMAGTWRQLDA